MSVVLDETFISITAKLSKHHIPNPSDRLCLLQSRILRTESELSNEPFLVVGVEKKKLE